MVAEARLFFRRQRGVALKLLEENLQRCHLRVQAQHLLGGGAVLEHRARDFLEELRAQVVGEVELCQLIPDNGKAAFPCAGRFLTVRVDDALPELGLHGFLAHLGFEALLRDDTAAI